MSQTVTLMPAHATSALYDLRDRGDMSMAPAVRDLVVSAAADVSAPSEHPTEVRLHAAVTDPGARSTRRSRLRAAHADARRRAEADGGVLELGHDTDYFISKLRGEISRATGRSQRPSMLSYLVRRVATLRPMATGSLDASPVN